MRKFLSVFSLFIILGLLAGCMEILPFDLTGSSEEPVETEEVVEVEAEDANVEEEVDQNVETDITEEVAADGDMATDGVTAVESASNQCPEENHDRLTEHLVPGFYIPECAALQGVSKVSNYVEGNLILENGDWEEVYEGYKDFFGENLSSDGLDFGNESAELYAYLLGDEENYTRIRINKHDQGVHIGIIQYFPE